MWSSVWFHRHSGASLVEQVGVTKVTRAIVRKRERHGDRFLKPHGKLPLETDSLIFHDATRNLEAFEKSLQAQRISTERTEDFKNAGHRAYQNLPGNTGTIACALLHHKWDPMETVRIDYRNLQDVIHKLWSQSLPLQCGGKKWVIEVLIADGSWDEGVPEEPYGQISRIQISRI